MINNGLWPGDERGEIWRKRIRASCSTNRHRGEFGEFREVELCAGKSRSVMWFG